MGLDSKLNKRFYVISANILESSDLLDDANFEELPGLLDKTDEATKIIVDTEIPGYWFINQKLFEGSIEIIKNKYNEEINELKMEDLWM